jgi:hypothetical protein
MFLEITSVPTELTTSITDLLLGAMSIGAFFIVRMQRSVNGCDDGACSLWAAAFGWMGFASVLGAIAHGFVWSPSVLQALWVPLYFALSMLVALVGLAAISHCWSNSFSRKLFPLAPLLAIAFTFLTQIWSNSFVMFIVYEAVMMTLALALYTKACFRRKDARGYGLIAFGILVSLVAAVFDTQSHLKFHWAWTFDCHGIFHLIQMLGMLPLFLGVTQRCVTRGEVYRSPVKLTRI